MNDPFANDFLSSLGEVIDFVKNKNKSNKVLFFSYYFDGRSGQSNIFNEH